MSLVRVLLGQLVELIDAGNSSLTEEEEQEVIDVLNKFSSKDEGMSKYSACQYLNISRATFDNLVKEGKLPGGRHIIGFKEKRWYKKDLDIFKKQCKYGY